MKNYNGGLFRETGQVQANLDATGKACCQFEYWPRAFGFSQLRLAVQTQVDI